ncbi:MAG TPA: hypothetical protein VLU94_03435 [Candidatus Nitrosotalea sp.]|nr:hypothetical protein [Candidatus Nitrosotalea sp.]
MLNGRLRWKVAALATGLIVIGAATLRAQKAPAALMAGGTARDNLSTTGLPSADEILARYEKFLGGKEALARVQTRIVWSRRIQDDGAPSETVLLRRSKRPNFSIMGRINLDGTFGDWTNGCDGTNGWSRDGQGIKEYNPNIAAGPICHQELYFYGYFPLDLEEMKKSYKSIEVKSELRIVQPPVSVYGALAGGKGKDLVPEGPRDAYLVLALPAREGDIGTWLVFDKETGALLRRQTDTTPVPAAPGSNGTFTSYLQYRAVGDGTVAPFQFASQNRGGLTRGVHTKIEDNTPMPDETFTKPKSANREDKGL